MALTLSEWSNVSDLVTAGVAVIALIGAIWQVLAAKKCQREATAAELYGNYLTLAVEHPLLADGYVSIPDASEPPKEEFERYEWFVSVMLHAFEQILDLTKDKVWRKAINDQLHYHKKYLAGPRFVAHHYSDDLVQMIAAVK